MIVSCPPHKGMAIQMDERSVKTIADIEAFLAGADRTHLLLSG